MSGEEGRKRVVIEAVTPEIDCGRFPIKRVRGERVIVEADAFTDGHDLLRCVLSYRRGETGSWTEVPMAALGNDRWRGEFAVSDLGVYQYTVTASVDRFMTWRRDLVKKVEAQQDVTLERLVGAELIQQAAKRASGATAEELRTWSRTLSAEAHGNAESIQLALDEELALQMARFPDTAFATTYSQALAVVVDPIRARFSAWYELFPRSCAPQPGQHGTFKDCEARLPSIASMGFDVLYFPPIHPIGRTHRKGRNNTSTAAADDPGSPWAIGAAEGGHKAIHPQLGTLQDFRRLVVRAREQGIDIALDIAFQCSPDHPYVKDHPQWFRWRPDGTVQYAENPPKKYQDIYPLEFESEQWQDLWEELLSVVLFWVEQGVRILRVDNPHTKPFRFWEWLIRQVKSQHSEVIFLAEAFTRPKVMARLAKAGFAQSYTYFPWRNTKAELTQYLTELTQTKLREFFRPNHWPNTPDILTEYLQLGGRPAFMARLVLAATLGASYGIYGPAFELGENRPREPGSEEYLDSEKYEIKHWETNRPDSLSDFVARVNRIRRENPALHSDWSLRFHPVDNEQLICYSKQTEDASNTIVVVVNLDPHHTQAGRVELPADMLAEGQAAPYQVHDLLSDGRFLWHGPRNFVELTPQVVPAHIFRIRRRVRTERDFEYYM
jgi:starch synthase (maltosyl-transferring)